MSLDRKKTLALIEKTEKEKKTPPPKPLEQVNGNKLIGHCSPNSKLRTFESILWQLLRIEHDRFCRRAQFQAREDRLGWGR
jgi:hypothetical protein